jgi:hypothetical protein
MRGGGFAPDEALTVTKALERGRRRIRRLRDLPIDGREPARQGAAFRNSPGARAPRACKRPAFKPMASSAPAPRIALPPLRTPRRRDLRRLADALRALAMGAVEQANPATPGWRWAWPTSCWALFDAQGSGYRAAVLGTAPRIAVEAASPFGWERYTGIGASAPADALYKHFGITAERIVEAALARLEQVRR